MSHPIILVTNPGSASRKYALYSGSQKLGSIHFETESNAVVYSINGGKTQPSGLSHIAFAASKLKDIIAEQQWSPSPNTIDAIAVRVVAPSTYFQQHRIIDSEARNQLKLLEQTAPLHINATTQEIELLERFLPHHSVIGISDSAFHATLPVFAHTYGISPTVAQQFDIKRFGYHGLSVQSVVAQLHQFHSTPERLIVCHLGSGSSVSAVLHGKSIDTTMGYSPLEGLLMSTRSGNIDPIALFTLQANMKLTPAKMQDYLFHQSGLLGVSGLSSDIRGLLEHEKTNQHAKLALQMYAYRVRQAIGQMSAALGGVDALVFTGTVGERSATMRSRICKPLQYLGVDLETSLNTKTTSGTSIQQLSHSGSPVTVYAVPTDEMGQMAQQAQPFVQI